MELASGDLASASIALASASSEWRPPPVIWHPPKMNVFSTEASSVAASRVAECFQRRPAPLLHRGWQKGELSDLALRARWLDRRCSAPDCNLLCEQVGTIAGLSSTRNAATELASVDSSSIAGLSSTRNAATELASVGSLASVGLPLLALSPPLAYLYWLASVGSLADSWLASVGSLADSWLASVGSLTSIGSPLLARDQTATSCHCWLAPPVDVHSMTDAPFAVEAPDTSAYRPLLWLTR